MKNLIKPEEEEVKSWILDVVKHSNHVEYYLFNLGLGKNDPERPHDLTGYMNKFDWEVLRGISLAKRKNINFEKQILPSIELHRNQYHHQMWNTPNKKAKKQDLFVGVVDTVCSMLEHRVYSGEDEELGRKKSWNVIEDVLYNKSPRYKSNAAKTIIPKIRELNRPALSKIKDVYDFPNIGIEEKIYEKMKTRINEVTCDLEKRGYFLSQMTQEL